MAAIEPESKNEFLAEAKKKQSGFLTEFWLFLRNNKKWWLTPVVIVLLLLGALVLLGSTGAGAFIYPLF